MDVLYFNVSGRTAHFKRPDVNAKTYFTYNHFPKVALLGMLGAVCGLGGYAEQHVKGLDYPEFYNVLKSLKVAVVPKGRPNGLFQKKIQVFNNSVGYASKEQGNNLIVREQWLEDVSWDIYLALDGAVDPEGEALLKAHLLNGEAVYPPYLGKNDHPATLTQGQLLEAVYTEDAETVDSLYLYDCITLDDDAPDTVQPFTFKDAMPCALNEVGMAINSKMGYTNRFIECTDEPLYRCNGLTLHFF